MGKIVDVDSIQWRLIIDFETKNAHSMDVGFAADTLRPITADNILARKLTEPEALQTLAKENPLELIKMLMESLDSKATVEQIEKILKPVVVPEEAWKKWWSNLRSRMKKSGHYAIPSRKIEPILYQPSVSSLQERYLNDLKLTRGFKAKLSLLNKSLQVLGEFEEPKAFADEVLPLLTRKSQSTRRANRSWRWRESSCAMSSKSGSRSIPRRRLLRKTSGPNAREPSRSLSNSPSPIRRAPCSPTKRAIPTPGQLRSWRI